MILHALKEYYDREAADPDSGVAPEGLENKPLEFLIVIDTEGSFICLEDTREKKEKKMVGKSFLLPRSKGRTGPKGYMTTFLLWDHIGYVLAKPETDKKSAKQHQTWRRSIDSLPDNIRADEGVSAILRFYQKRGVEFVVKDPVYEECLKSIPCNMSFRLANDPWPVPCRPLVREYARHLAVSEESTAVEEKVRPQNASVQFGYCLISGKRGEIARTHAKTPINKDANSFVGVQRNCGYDSYGKEQGFNAPISKSSEFAYTTALNTLLKNRSQRLNIGGCAMVFWSSTRTDFETDFSFIFKKPDKDDPDRGIQAIKSLYSSVKNGAYIKNDGDHSFYVLGLSPGGGSRIAIRFWQHGAIRDFANSIHLHFNDLAIAKPSTDPEHYSLWSILVNIAVQGESENIPPNIAADFIRAVLTDSPYPVTVLQSALRRTRSGIKRDTKNGKVIDRVTPVIASIIKACLNRYQRVYGTPNNKEISMTLDVSQPSIGYQLGRLFATLEKIQEEANPGLNATIRERYYGAACSSPVTVFANLMRLKNHHLAKMERKGRVINFEQLLSEIVGRFQDFPAHLDLHEQGRFAIGYYHQRQDFFTKKETKESAEQAR